MVNLALPTPDIATHMQMKVPSRAPIRLTRSLKKGIASAMMKLMIQLIVTQELKYSQRDSQRRVDSTHIHTA